MFAYIIYLEFDMKLIIVNQTEITPYFFNKTDSQLIKDRCQAVGKQWSEHLLGFFINLSDQDAYAAITVKAEDGVIECMEYIDIDRGKPEFTISQDLISKLRASTANNEVKLSDFEPILSEILGAPMKARKWEVYPEINQHYPQEH